MAKTFKAEGEIVFNDGVGTSSEEFPKIEKVGFLLLYPIRTSVIVGEGVYGKSDMGGRYECKIEKEGETTFLSCKPPKVKVFK